MSYCRFSECDVYFFEHVDGFFQCCACNLAEKVPTIFTEECSYCDGKGCEGCMMHDSVNVKTEEEAIQHLEKHKAIQRRCERENAVLDRAINELKYEIEERNRRKKNGHVS